MSNVFVEGGSMKLMCKACGEEYQPNLPVQLELYIALANKFELMHRSCRKRVEEIAGDE